LDEEARVARVLKVTAKGQVTLRREVLRHLGVDEGASVAVELLPGGRAELRAVAAGGSIEDFFRCLPPSRARLTIEDIGDVAAQGWAGRA
jgi:bifunctional DNA-binding transcriptional regulator/antitoxin component of YhaV-PrlF toxin-antitoxin module